MLKERVRQYKIKRPVFKRQIVHVRGYFYVIGIFFHLPVIYVQGYKQSKFAFKAGQADGIASGAQMQDFYGVFYVKSAQPPVNIIIKNIVRKNNFSQFQYKSHM